MKSEEYNAPPLSVIAFQVCYQVTLDCKGVEDSTVEETHCEDYSNEHLFSIVAPEILRFEVPPQEAVCRHHEEESQIEEYSDELETPKKILERVLYGSFSKPSPWPEQGSTSKTAQTIHIATKTSAINT